MLIFKFIGIVIMCIGLLCTLAPRLYGNIIILLVAIFYDFILGAHIFQSWVGSMLLLLAFVAEVGVRWVRRYLTRQYQVSRKYAVDTSICNVAGIILACTLFGTFLGSLAWEIIVGKTLMARLPTINTILTRLVITGGIRMFCAFLMIVMILRYVMYTI